MEKSFRAGYISTMTCEHFMHVGVDLTTQTHVLHWIQKIQTVENIYIST